MLGALAWRNIWRQPQRTALSLISIALACAITIFLLSLQLGTYTTMKENVLHLLDGYAQIQPPGYAADPDIRKTIANPDAIMTALRGIPGISASAPRATSYVILASGSRSYGAAVLGVDPAREIHVSSLASTVTRGRYLRSGDTDAAVVGTGLARNLKLSIGSRLTLLGSARDGSIAADVLIVRGIVATGSPQIDRQVIEMPLSRFQADFALGHRVNTIAIAGRHLASVTASLPALRRLAHKRGLVVRDWTRLEPALHDVILLDMSFSVLLYASLIVVVVFIILNTLLMSILERTREFGVLLALGMRPSQIGRMIWLELMFLAGAGMLIGVALGSTITFMFVSHGIAFAGAEALFRQWHMPSTLYPELDLKTALAGPAAIALSIMVSGIVPYLRMRRLTPLSAMRSA
ncbi:MAG: ABC transporter permease [Alphaproteobacteria bacterium]|nr:ABC transporter permease [Alphaproteobacteria bacterium]